MNRAVAGTNQNERSSRSHTIFIIEIEQKNADGSTKTCRLNLVDLAGSERIAKTGAEGQTLKEAMNINGSLTTLGLCIKTLTEKKGHVPFRDSKLTFFLKESLGGNAKTALMCTASRQSRHVEESLQTLQFASRAKKIKNKAVSNVIVSQKNKARLLKSIFQQSPKEMMDTINKMKTEVAALKKQLVSNGIKPDIKAFKPKVVKIL